VNGFEAKLSGGSAAVSRRSSLRRDKVKHSLVQIRRHSVDIDRLRQIESPKHLLFVKLAKTKIPVPVFVLVRGSGLNNQGVGKSRNMNITGVKTGRGDLNFGAREKLPTSARQK
jgi:hypothetical protein